MLWIYLIAAAGWGKVFYDECVFESVDHPILISFLAGVFWPVVVLFLYLPIDLN